SGLRSIANQLVAQGVIQEPWRFIVLAKLLNKESTLQAGNYTLNKNVSPYQLLLSLNNGKATQGSITFIEGRTFVQMREKMARNDALKQTVTNLSEAEILKLVGSNRTKAEGLFFPDTFYFDRNTADTVILQRSYDAMQSKLEAAWQKRAPNLPYKNSYEALIMASIVEKETGKASERAMIAGVFINRLRVGMRLQTDPTVIYGMGDEYQGNIRKKDLLKDTPYNTYTRDGLPPTPIAMPGLAAIEAALHPETTKALYFVGKGDGSHAFSNSLQEHNRAVVKYQLKK
ncbi:MAG TPA: endolytic transglycosylase MltG, partial [Methylophilaceae bacterium]|nr:endolytic transglycosylase MltG [Methylophilaceae bacterium]